MQFEKAFFFPLHTVGVVTYLVCTNCNHQICSHCIAAWLFFSPFVFLHLIIYIILHFYVWLIFKPFLQLPR